MKVLAFYLLLVAVATWLLVAPYWELYGTLHGYVGNLTP